VWGVRVARSLPAADFVLCNTVTLPIWLKRLVPKAGKVAAVIARQPRGRSRVYGKVDLLLALSRSVSDQIGKENPRLADRIVRFPYPIDWSALSGPARPSAGVLTVGYVGRVHPEKGIELLLQAGERLAQRRDLPEWSLVVVGPVEVRQGGGGHGWWNGLLERSSPGLRARLVFRGPEFDADALARHYRSIDVFCYPSVAEGETFGVAVAEAMAAGCAPVVSGLACFEDLVVDGETGLVFDHTGEGAAERLAGALARLALDQKLRSGLAGRARSYSRRYDFPECAEALLATLGRLQAGTEPNIP
jgi:glycosyltransferase involved in cell wall biosynthesis